MRIVAGRHRGRALLAPPGRALRPTADRTRQALFDVLEHAPWAFAGRGLGGATVLDAFCGTGALGLEARSRGGAAVTFIDQDRAHLGLARRNAETLGESGIFLLGDATRPPQAEQPVRLAFLDPPYAMGLLAPALTALAAAGWFTADTLIVTETSAKAPDPLAEGYELLGERRYGAALLRFVNAPA